MSTQERQLKAEIGFWRELINCPERQPSERSLERMQQALAERKLQALASRRNFPVVEWAELLISRFPASPCGRRRLHSKSTDIGPPQDHKKPPRSLGRSVTGPNQVPARALIGFT